MVISFAFRSICTIFAGDMEVISMPVWAWILFYVLVLVMLVIDLKSFGRKGQHEVSVSEALKMTAVWIGVSLIFCGGIWLYEGDEKAMEFLAGYLIEKSLSMDNLFVFLMLFRSTLLGYLRCLGATQHLHLCRNSHHQPVRVDTRCVRCFPYLYRYQDVRSSGR